MGMVFVCAWGVFAVALGSLFAFRPDIPADTYFTRVARFRTTARLRERLAPRKFVLILYRVGGGLFLGLRVLLPILAVAGVLPTGG